MATTGKWRATLYLLMASFLWGLTFVAQSIAAEKLGPYTFNASRYFFGFVVLLPIALLLGRKDPLSINYKDGPAPGQWKLLLWSGFLIGLILSLAGNLQQIGIRYTTAGKSGFVTALYIVIVPILSYLFWRKKSSPLMIPSVALAIIGFFMLCVKDGFAINRGDLITLGCAVVFALHILTVGHFSTRVNPVQLSMMQFLFAGGFSLLMALVLETPHLHDLLLCWKPIAFSGLFACGVAYTLQILGQRNLHPAAAALLMSLESVFAALAGWVILGDRLTSRELFGCVLVFLAVLLAQLPLPSRLHRTS